MSDEKIISDAIDKITKVAESFRQDYIREKSLEHISAISDPNKRIADALQKIASDLTLFRIQYDFECTIKKIRQDVPDDKWIKDLEENDKKVQVNIDSWRDYIQKYSLVLIAVSGFFVSLITFLKPANINQIMHGFLPLGISLVMIFITIFGTLFLQRKIIDGNSAFSMWCRKPYTEHPDETNYSDAVRRNLKEHIQKLKEKLSRETDSKKKRDLKRSIATDSKSLSDMKYTGGTYLFFEQIRNLVTIIILVTSFWGIAQITYALLSPNNIISVQEEAKNSNVIKGEIQLPQLKSSVEPTSNKQGTKK